jgi:hypothetical protein
MRGRVLLGAVTLVLLAPAAARAAMVTPNRLDDPTQMGNGSCATAGPCSLREAVNYAGAGGTVNLPTPAVGTVDTYALTQGYLHLPASVTITGPGARVAIIKQNTMNSNVIYADSASSVIAISGVMITGGAVSGSGGGILNSGTMTLTNVAVTGNTVSGQHVPDPSMMGPGFDFPGNGGGIWNSGTMTITASTISGDSATQGTSQIFGPSGGGIFNTSTLTIVNSTISGNSATGVGVGGGGGGGIDSSSGTLRLANATLSGNSASAGIPGGNLDGTGAGMTITDSIISGGGGTTGSENCSFGDSHMPASSYDIEDRNQCGFTGIGDQHNANPLLGALQNNGGPTQTMALPANSPAVDHGNPSGCPNPPGGTLTSDQRGQPRPGSAACDLGAFEGSFPPTVSPTISGSPAVGQTLTCSPGANSGVPATTTFQWLRDGASIAGSAAYTVTIADAGHALTCRVTATNLDGTATQTSPPVLVPAGVCACPAGGILSPFHGLTLLIRSLIMRNGIIAVSVSCPAAAVGFCDGSLTLSERVLGNRALGAAKPRRKRIRRVTLGSARFSIPSGKTATVKIHVKALKQAIIRAGTHGLKARLTMAARDRAGRAITNTAIVTIRTPPRRRHH